MERECGSQMVIRSSLQTDITSLHLAEVAEVAGAPEVHQHITLVQEVVLPVAEVVVEVEEYRYIPIAIAISRLEVVDREVNQQH